MADWREEIVWIRTDDGIRLDAAVLRPTGTPTGTALVWIHGFTGHFSEPHTVAIGRYLASRGQVFLTANNRGHHQGAGLGQRDGRPLMGGAWWELVSESWLDVKAALDFAAGLGATRIALAGHSYGALKVVWYQGDRQDPRVAGLISASGPVPPLSRRPESSDPLAEAERMVAAGRGMELLPFGSVGRGFGTMSAQSLVDRARSLPDVYGVEGGDSPLGRVRCPFLAILGTNEPEIGTAPDLDLIKRNARSAAHADTALIDGADHVYTGREEAVARAIDDWLASLR